MNAKYLFPFTSEKTLDECLVTSKFLPGDDTFGYYITVGPYIFLLISAILRGYVASWANIPLLSTLVAFKAHLNSGWFVTFCLFIANVAAELLILRLFFLKASTDGVYENLKVVFHSSSEKVQRQIIWGLKICALVIMFTTYVTNVPFFYVQWHLAESSIEQFFVCFTFSLVAAYASYITTDAALCYSVAFVSLYQVNKKKRSLFDVVIQLSKSAHKEESRVAEIFVKYKQLITIIQQYNPLAQALITINKLVATSGFAICAIMLSIESDTWAVTLAKYTLGIVGGVYAFRGYVCTRFFAQIHLSSQKLVKTLYSVAIRGDTLSWQSKFAIKCLIEELTDVHTHFALTELGLERITQRDLILSIVSTMQLIILGFDFRKSFRI